MKRSDYTRVRDCYSDKCEASPEQITEKNPYDTLSEVKPTRNHRQLPGWAIILPREPIYEPLKTLIFEGEDENNAAN